MSESTRPRPRSSEAVLQARGAGACRVVVVVGAWRQSFYRKKKRSRNLVASHVVVSPEQLRSGSGRIGPPGWLILLLPVQ